MIKGMALPSGAPKHAMPLSMTYVGDAEESRPVAPPHRRKTKGIPALHWTTVHSPFGNRDRRGKKSFATTASPAAPGAYYNRGPRIKFLPAGLFDPTFKKDQLESDERKSDLQRRRRLRHNRDPSAGLQETVSQVSLVPYVRHSRSTDDLSNVTRGQCSASQQSWKREASLSELLLAGPTFREIIAQEVKAQRGVHLRRCNSTFSPQEVNVIQTKLKLQNVDWSAQPHFAVQLGLQERKEIESVRPTQHQKLAPPILHRQGEAEYSGSKKEAAAGLRMAENFPPGYQAHPASGRKLHDGKEHLSRLNASPIAELSISGCVANLNNLAAKPTNAPQTPVDSEIFATSILPHHDQGLGRLNTPANMVSSLHETTGSGTAGRRSLRLLKDTIDRVNKLQQRVGAAFLPEAIKRGLPNILGGCSANQLWLETVLMELAEALRSGPSDGTEEGKTYLLSFLQQQRGRELRKKGVLLLLKRIRHRLCQAAKCAFACLPSSVFLTSGAPSTRCLKASQNCLSCATQPEADLGANYPQSNKSAGEPAVRLQPPLADARISCALPKPCTEDLQPISTIPPLEAPNNQVQENSENQNSCRPPTVDGLEVSKLRMKAAHSQSTDHCIRKRMPLKQQRGVFKQSISDSSSCLVQVRGAECHASATLQNFESLPLLNDPRKPSAVVEGMLGAKLDMIGTGSPLYPASLVNFRNVKETVELAARTEAGEGLSRGELQCSRVVLSSAMEETVLAFRESRRKTQLNNEPLLQHKSLQHALIQLKEQCGGRTCFENEQAGIWMLHDAIVEQLLDREMKELVSCVDSVTRMFVDRLFETEAIRMAVLVRPACQKQLGSVAEAC